MKNLTRASRRHKSRCQYNRLLAALFAVNTAHETKDETAEMIRKRIHCETTGRRGIALIGRKPVLTPKL